MAQRNFQKSVIEVAYIICHKCCQRLECELNGGGTAVAQLERLFATHWNSSPGHLPAIKKSELFADTFKIDVRWFREQVRTEEIDLDEDIDLGDILSSSQLHQRARRLARRYRMDPPSALKLVKRHITQLVLKSDAKFICRSCGRYITPRMAERGGYGRECNATRRAS